MEYTIVHYILLTNTVPRHGTCPEDDQVTFVTCETECIVSRNRMVRCGLKMTAHAPSTLPFFPFCPRL